MDLFESIGSKELEKNSDFSAYKNKENELYKKIYSENVIKDTDYDAMTA